MWLEGCLGGFAVVVLCLNWRIVEYYHGCFIFVDLSMKGFIEWNHELFWAHTIVIYHDMEFSAETVKRLTVLTSLWSLKASNEAICNCNGMLHSEFYNFFFKNRNTVKLA